jgi:hypothetical protein
MAFTEKLSDEGLKYFSDIGQKPFSQQAVAFLNAYWPEVRCTHAVAIVPARPSRRVASCPR